MEMPQTRRDAKKRTLGMAVRKVSGRTDKEDRSFSQPFAASIRNQLPYSTLISLDRKRGTGCFSIKKQPVPFFSSYYPGFSMVMLRD
jgi:hypothetical protein